MQCNFQGALQEYRQRRVQTAVYNIDVLMEEGRFKEAWDHITRWYRQAQGKQAHTTRERVDQYSVDRAKLYICRPLARLKVLILVPPVTVNDDVLAEVEINLEVWGMKVGRAGGMSGMIENELKGWRNEAKCYKEPKGRRC